MTREVWKIYITGLCFGIAVGVGLSFMGVNPLTALIVFFVALMIGIAILIID